MEKMAARNWCA